MFALFALYQNTVLVVTTVMTSLVKHLESKKHTIDSAAIKLAADRHNTNENARGWKASSLVIVRMWLGSTSKEN